VALLRELDEDEPPRRIDDGPRPQETATHRDAARV